MTEGSPWRHIVFFTVPVFLGALLQQLYNTADTIIVGQFVDESSLAAVGTTNSINFLFLSLAFGFSAGNGIIVSQHYGAKEFEAVRRIASSGILFLLALSLAATAAGIVFAPKIFHDISAVPYEIFDQTVLYFRCYAMGFFFQFGYNILAAILRALGDSRAMLYFLLISSIVNVLLDLLFVPVFHWGVFGAALATDLAQGLSFAAAIVYIRKYYPIFRYKWNEYVWDKKAVIKTITVGLPITAQLAIVSLGLSLIQRAVNEFGEVMTASFTVGHRIEMYLNLPCNSFQIALATFTGQNIGAGKMERVKLGAWQTLFISLVLTILIGICVWITAPWIISLFGLSPEAASYCAMHLKTVSFVNVILSLYVPIFGVFQGANHTTFPTMVAGCALTIRVLTTYLFRHGSFLGASIIWWNGAFGYSVGCFVTWCFYLSGVWKQNSSIVEQKRESAAR